MKASRLARLYKIKRNKKGKMRLRLSLTINWAKLNAKNMDEKDGGRTDDLAKGKGRLGQYIHNRVIREVEAAGTTGGINQ